MVSCLGIRTRRIGADLVAQVGLCIGHDLVLQEESDAAVTTLVVKDRALDHHPVRALRPQKPRLTASAA